MRQSGSVILEALIAILIFSIGILAMVGMQATTINNMADAKYRADASFLADQIIGTMWANRLSVTNASGVTTSTPDPAFACASCVGGGGNAETQAWAGASGVAGLLPQAGAAIAVSGVQVTVTLTWQPPRSLTPHRHTTAAFIN